MNRLFASVVIAAAWGCAHAQDAPTYKGVALGITMEEFKDKMPLFECGATECRYSITSCAQIQKHMPDECREATSFGGQPIEYAFARFIEGRLGSLSFILPTRSAERAMQAATERYGKPDAIDEEPFRTRAGASFPNLAASWRRGEITMRITLNSGKLGDGYASIQSAWYAQQAEAQRKAATSKSAKDF